MPMKASDAFRCCFVLLLCLATPVRALEAVSLHLNFTHQFQFAGYYAAIEQGYYREAGLEVTLVEGSGVPPAEAAVLSGQAEYGVGNSTLLLSRLAGKPVVVLAVVFQHSPSVLLMRQQGGAPDVRKLVGAPVMIGAAVNVAAASDEVSLFLGKMGVAPQQMRHLPPSYRIEDLIDGKVDAIAAYSTNEPDYLDRAGFSYYQFTPRTAGIDFYGDNLFTSEQELRRHPERVKAFRAASLRGWQYAMAHREEMARPDPRQIQPAPRPRAPAVRGAADGVAAAARAGGARLHESRALAAHRRHLRGHGHAAAKPRPAAPTRASCTAPCQAPTWAGCTCRWAWRAACWPCRRGFHFSILARERRRAEETIRQGELRFRTMFEEAPHGHRPDRFRERTVSGYQSALSGHRRAHPGAT